jgi:hypothetical protein
LSLRSLIVLGIVISVGFWSLRPDVVVVDPATFNSLLLTQLSDQSVQGEPVQLDIQDAPVLDWSGIELRPRALFGLESRVLGTRRYRFGQETDVSNIDVAFGWGRMADPEIVSQLAISQSGRFYFWRARELPIPAAEIVHSSANMHMIAANDNVRRELKRLKEGDQVRLHGVLVDVHWPNGGYWKTSLTREDSGAGACEIVWVHHLERLP